MNDNELRDKLAENYVDANEITDSEDGFTYSCNERLEAVRAYKAAWDAARANPLRDEKRL